MIPNTLHELNRIKKLLDFAVRSLDIANVLNPEEIWRLKIASMVIALGWNRRDRSQSGIKSIKNAGKKVV